MAAPEAPRRGDARAGGMHASAMAARPVVRHLRRDVTPWPMRLVSKGSIALLVVTLLPLAIISLYNHSYADDWHYAVPVHQILQATGGDPFAALGAAFQQVGNTYIDWQGTYTAIFLMALEPGVFSEDLYVIAAPIILGTLVACTFWAAHVALVEWLHTDRETWISVSCLVIVLQVLFQPSPVEGIFWYNSAIYYTFFHSLALVLLGQVMRAIDPSRMRDTRKLVTGSTVLAILVAGGNFVTALVCCEVLGALAVVLAVRHRDCVISVLPPLTGLLCGTILSMAAPGNAVRQATQFPEDKLGVAQTIWQSSVATFQYMSSWTTGLMVLGFLAIAVLLARASFSPVARRWDFRLPGVVSVASVALLATSFTPTFFSMGTVGPGRVQNVRLDLYVVLVVVNLAWWLGWAAERVRRAGGLDERDRLAMRRDGAAPVPAIGSKSVGCAVGLIMLVFCLTVGAMYTDAKQVDSLTFTSATKSLVTGQAAAYDQQVRDRISTIENSTDDSLEVPFYTNAPKVLFMGDIRDNMDNYINYRLAQWYGKTSIIGVYK